MNVIGFNRYGLIEIEIDGQHVTVPDVPENPHRQLIAEWEFDQKGERVNTIPPFTPPAKTESEVDAERDRRIADGFTFNGFFYQSRRADRENIAGAAVAALAAVSSGAQVGDYRWHGGDSDFMWIAADNTMHPLDAQSTFAMGQAAMAHKQAHIFAARAIKDMNPIPADYATNPAYWP